MFQFWFDSEGLACSERLQIWEILLGTCCYHEETRELGILDCETAGCGTAAVDQKDGFLRGGSGWKGEF